MLEGFPILTRLTVVVQVEDNLERQACAYRKRPRKFLLSLKEGVRSLNRSSIVAAPTKLNRYNSLELVRLLPARSVIQELYQVGLPPFSDLIELLDELSYFTNSAL